jgi:serine/threonine protein kinase
MLCSITLQVIVMELACGGDVFDRIKGKGAGITEAYLARSFHTALLALQEVHAARYLHRDLKVENLIAISREDNSAIKLIDFGMMVRLPEGEDRLIDPQKPGTPSYIAPESYALGRYTCKSDVWQAGLSLYCALCAEYAFDSLPHSRGPLQRWAFKREAAFQRLSASAQGLLARMLHPVERERLDLASALAHPWFHGEAPNILLGEVYEKKIRKLKLRKNLRNFFTGTDVAVDAAERTAAFRQNLSSARTPRGLSAFKGVPVESLSRLKEVVYRGLVEKVRRSSSGPSPAAAGAGSFIGAGAGSELDEDTDADANGGADADGGGGGSPLPILRRTTTDLVRDGEVDFDGFCQLMGR